MKESPGKFKNLIRRAARVEVHRIMAMLDAAVRGMWGRAEMARHELVGTPLHGCLTCKISFPCQQAYAARKHQYRSRGHLLTRGTQCQACRRTFASAQKLTLHLKYTPDCLGLVEGMFREGRLEVLRDEQLHAQAPPPAASAACQCS